MNRSHRSLLFLAATLPFLMIGAAAHADETPTAAVINSSGSSGSPFTVSAGPFGDTGQWVYSISDPNEFPFQFLKTGGDAWAFVIEPAADTFISRNVSVGGLARFVKNGGVSEIGFGGRFGFNAVLTSLISVWIRGDVIFDHQAVTNAPSVTQTQLDVKAPFLFHLVPHFFVGVGPQIQLWLQRTGNNPKDATYGLGAIVGGYL